MIQVTVPNFFYFDVIPKINVLEPKKTFIFGHFRAFYKKWAKNEGFLALARLFLGLRQNKKKLEQ